MLTYTQHAVCGTSLTHEVSIRGAPSGCAFVSVSTISITPPQSGQVGCHSSSVLDGAAHSGSGVAVAASWLDLDGDEYGEPQPDTVTLQDRTRGLDAGPPAGHTLPCTPS